MDDISIINMDNMVIEKMSKYDISQISNIEKLCFSRPWSYDSIYEELSNQNACFYVAKCNDTVLGYIGMHGICKEGYVANLAVDPSYRNKGVAKSLLSYILNYAEKNDYSFVSLEVRESNIPAISLYKSKGFVCVGKRKSFYSDPKEDAMIMTYYF